MQFLIILLLAYLAVGNIESEESAHSIDVKTPTQWNYLEIRNDLIRPELFTASIDNVQTKYLQEWWVFATVSPTYRELAEKEGVSGIRQYYIDGDNNTAYTTKYYTTQEDEPWSNQLHSGWYRVVVLYKNGDSKVVAINNHNETANTYHWHYSDLFAYMR